MSCADARLCVGGGTGPPGPPRRPPTARLGEARLPRAGGQSGALARERCPATLPALAETRSRCGQRRYPRGAGRTADHRHGAYPRPHQAVQGGAGYTGRAGLEMGRGPTRGRAATTPPPHTQPFTVNGCVRVASGQQGGTGGAGLVVVRAPGRERRHRGGRADVATRRRPPAPLGHRCPSREGTSGERAGAPGRVAHGRLAVVTLRTERLHRVGTAPGPG